MTQPPSAQSQPSRSAGRWIFLAVKIAVSLGLLVLLTTCVAPLLQLLCLLYLLWPLRRRRRARHQRTVFRVLTHVRDWTFFEMFLLGVLVAGLSGRQ